MNKPYNLITHNSITQSELNRLAQQLQDLRDALRPFAVFAEALPPIIEGEPRLTDTGPAFTASPLGKNYVITFADLRKALALLSALEEQDKDRWVAEVEEKALRVACRKCGCFLCKEEAGLLE